MLTLEHQWCAQSLIISPATSMNGEPLVVDTDYSEVISSLTSTIVLDGSAATTTSCEPADTGYSRYSSISCASHLHGASKAPNSLTLPRSSGHQFFLMSSNFIVCLTEFTQNNFNICCVNVSCVLQNFTDRDCLVDVIACFETETLNHRFGTRSLRVI